MCACALNKALRRAAATVFQLADTGTGVLMAEPEDVLWNLLGSWPEVPGMAASFLSERDKRTQLASPAGVATRGSCRFDC